MQELDWEMGSGDCGPNGCWSWESDSCLADTLPVSEFVAGAMAEAGYPEHDVFEMRLALDEVLSRAVDDDPSKLFHVRCRIDAACVVAEIEDEASRFVPHMEDDRPDLHLLRRCLTWMDCDKQGSYLTLCKCRSAC